MTTGIVPSSSAAPAASPGRTDPGWTRRALQLALAINSAMLLVYLLVTMRMVFTSDFGAKNVIASLILEQRRFFPQGFGFSSDIWILHGHLPLLVLIPMFGNTFLSNALSSVVFAAVFLPLVYLFLRRCSVRPEAALLTTLIVACGFSEDWAAFMYGEAAYGYVCLPILFGLFAVSEGLLAPASPRRLALLFAVCVLQGAYGGRGLVTFALPAAASLVLMRLEGRASDLRARQAIVAVAGLAVGLMGRLWVTSRILIAPFWSSWVTAGQVSPDGLLQAITGLFSLLPSEPMPTDTVWGLVFPLRTGFALGLVILAVLASRSTGTGSDRRRFVVLFAWIGMALTVYLTVTLLRLAGQPRFLIPPAFVVILVTAFALDAIAARAAGRRWMALAAAPMLVLSFVTYVAPLIPAESGGVPWQRAYERVRRLDRLMPALEQWGVAHVYSSYVNSTALTVLSDSRIKARQVLFAEFGGVPTPGRWLALDQWYVDSRFPTALIVDLADPGERAHFGIERLEALLGPPLGSEEREGYLVVRYPHNAFARLPEWQKQNFASGLVPLVELGPAAVSSLPGVGRMEAGLLVSTGTPGALVYGPYIQLPEGRYRVRLNLAVRGDGVSPGYWDVYADSPPVTLARGDLPASADENELVVDRTIEIAPHQRSLRIEVRVVASGAGRIGFRRMEIERVE